MAPAATSTDRQAPSSLYTFTTCTPRTPGDLGEGRSDSTLWLTLSAGTRIPRPHLHQRGLATPFLSLFQNNSHRGGWSLEAAPLHRRNHQELVSVKVGCRAQGRGWGWRVERLPETLLEVSYGNEQGIEALCVSQRWLASLSADLPTNAFPLPHPTCCWGWAKAATASHPLAEGYQGAEESQARSRELGTHLLGSC